MARAPTQVIIGETAKRIHQDGQTGAQLTVTTYASLVEGKEKRETGLCPNETRVFEYPPAFFPW